jgi:hypothetical protein
MNDRRNYSSLTLSSETITFGKFHKAHPCNLREFKIYGGLSPNLSQMSLLYQGGLKNDSIPETFDLKVVNSGGVVRGRPLLLCRVVSHTAFPRFYLASI